jgi:1-acyl-sn-glycerol-3-phosphate acyltransferase
MSDRRKTRPNQQLKARASQIKSRMPDRLPDINAKDVRERLPEIKDFGDRAGKELRTRGKAARHEIARQYAKMDKSWARGSSAGAVRWFLLIGVLGPLMGWYMRRRVVGKDVFGEDLGEPVIFVANHSSHLDTPTVLKSIPPRWRRRTAVAAAADYFYKSRWKASGVALLFNTIPLGRQGGGLGNGATDHVDRLIEDKWNLLMFPEGTRSRKGDLGKVRSGAAVLAAQHGLSIVPIHVRGTHETMPPGQAWPKRMPGRVFSRRHTVEVRFGEPIRPQDVAERHEVMEQVRLFWEREGEAEEPAAEGPAIDVLIMHEVLRAQEAREESGYAA